MLEKSRFGEGQNKIFKNNEGLKLHGWSFIIKKNAANNGSLYTIEIHFSEGRINNGEEAAIIFPDGHSEQWMQGEFVRILKKAHGFRTLSVVLNY